MIPFTYDEIKQAHDEIQEGNQVTLNQMLIFFYLGIDTEEYEGKGRDYRKKLRALLMRKAKEQQRLSIAR